MMKIVGDDVRKLHIEHPNSNIQHPEKLQSSNSKLRGRFKLFGAWRLGISLDVGCWSLEV